MQRPPRALPAARDWWWRWDPRESLRARAALVFGGGAILFTLLIAAIGSAVYRRHLAARLGSTFEAMAVQASSTVDRRLLERYREVELLAGLTPFRDRRAAAGDRRRILEALQMVAPDFAWIGFADRAGQIVAATQGQFEAESARERAWFAGAQARPYAGTLREMPAVTATPGERDRDPRVFDFAVPVLGVDGEFAGVIGAHLRWGWARDAQLAVLPETAARQQLGVTLYGAGGEVLVDAGATGWTEPPDPPVIPVGQFRGTLLETTAEGSVYFTAYVRSRGHEEYRGLGWLTVVRQPVARAFAPVRELQFTVARWGFVFSALFLVASWVFTGRIARRLEAVATAADRIRKGDILALMPQPRGATELDRMCGAVSELVQDLRPKDVRPPPEAPPPPAGPSGYVRPTGTDPRRVIW